MAVNQHKSVNEVLASLLQIDNTIAPTPTNIAATLAPTFPAPFCLTGAVLSAALAL